MKQFFTTAILGAALVAGSAPQAKATAIATFTLAQIVNQINLLPSSAFSAGCGSSSFISSCGLWEIGFVSSSNTTSSQQASVTLGASPSTFWSAGTYLGSKGWEQTTTGTNNLQLVGCTSGSNGCTSTTPTPSGNYTSTQSSGTATPNGTPLIPLSTQIQFILGNESAGNITINLLVRAVGINGNGSSGVVKASQAIAFTNFAVSNTPEPGTILLALTGIAVIGFGKFRRKNV